MVDKRSVCDGIEIDKNIIASYLKKAQQGTADFQLVRVYYSADGKRCQSGNCNKRIRNVFVFVDNDTSQEYEIGSHCATKYGNDIDKLVQYWLKKLNYATAHTLKKAKQEERVRENIETHHERHEFAQAYLEVAPSNFIASIKNVIEQGWSLSEKQIAAFDEVMVKTNLTELAAKQGADYARYKARLIETLTIIERLDQVSFGQRGVVYSSIRDFFSGRGYVTDKQLNLLQKYMYTFRKQLKKLGVPSGTWKSGTQTA